MHFIEKPEEIQAFFMILLLIRKDEDDHLRILIA